jgi:hypothetical protein
MLTALVRLTGSRALVPLGTRGLRAIAPTKSTQVFCSPVRIKRYPRIVWRKPKVRTHCWLFVLVRVPDEVRFMRGSRVTCEYKENMVIDKEHGEDFVGEVQKSP